jgi:hypothetical protein
MRDRRLPQAVQIFLDELVSALPADQTAPADLQGMFENHAS